MGKQWKQWQTLFWEAPKSLQMVTADMKLRRLLLGRKVMTTLDSILKSRDITLQTKVLIVKAMVFAVIIYEHEGWTIKKVECQRIDAFELWCWRRLLRVPWTANRSSQSILKEISPECSLERLMLKLKLQYFGHLMQNTDSMGKLWCWERLKAGREGDDRGWDWWMASPTWCTWVWASSGSWWWTGKPGMLQSMGSQRIRHDWTELSWNASKGSVHFTLRLKKDFNKQLSRLWMRIKSKYHVFIDLEYDSYISFLKEVSKEKNRISNKCWKTK